MSRINRKLRGWSNYFRIGTVSKAYRNINSHTRYRVRQWLCAKFKEQGQGKERFLTNTCTRSWDCTPRSPFEGKLSRAVLKGQGDGDATSLPDTWVGNHPGLPGPRSPANRTPPLRIRCTVNL